MRMVALFLLMLMFSAGAAMAQGTVVDAGPVSTYNLNTDDVSNFPDIYTRQLAYVEERKKLRAQLEERQKNFNAPREEAHRNYIKNRAALWAGGNVGNQ